MIRIRGSSGASLLALAALLRREVPVNVRTMSGKRFRGRLRAISLHPCLVLEDGTCLALSVVDSIEEADSDAGDS